MSLADFGWTPFFQSQLTDPTLTPARVLSHLGDRLLVHDGSSEFNSMLRGSLRKHPNYPIAVGDFVAVEGQGDQSIVANIFDRRTSIARKRAGTQAGSQVLAANIDHVLIVMSVNEDYNVHRLERYLTLVWESGASPIIILTKVDLVEDRAPFIEPAESRAMGFPVVCVSNKTGEGLGHLRTLLHPQQTIVVVGSSGVGKSTLINTIAGQDLRKTGEIREGDGTGRHVTTDRHLLRLPSGVLVIDTPGLREVQLWAERESVDTTFAEIVELASQCRFTDCSHGPEPGCAVTAAIEAGEIDADRLSSYLQIRGEAEHLKRQTDSVEAKTYKSKMKQLMKSQKQHYKISPKTQE
jgi:ribosome biogenesis GTPase / thiamine phosphate phosphatase